MKKGVLSELRNIYEEEKVLRPKDVVDRARDKRNPLHDEFTWDNNKAAEEYRLHEARRLITIAVEVLPDLAEPMEVQVFQSLPTDRKKNGGGYRSTTDILSHAEMREELIECAMSELVRIRNRYKHVTELSEAWLAVDREVEKRKGKKKQRRPEGAVA